MGINPTPTNYKSFTFDGKSSREFGVYTTGEGVFNAPERAVEMISIPARNGDYALDLGHFENIEVKYRCGIVTDDETDFAEAVSDFRNWLCSRRGYCRITDEYNPDEYRMGLFKSVIEVDHDGLETGEFNVTFNCKPQRWLTSGETATSIADGGTVTNPTLFDSSPLLEVEGYGTIDLGGQEIEIENVAIGDIVLYSGGKTKTVTLDESNLNVGDEITVNANQNITSIKAVYSQSTSVHNASLSASCSHSGFSVVYSGRSSMSASTTFTLTTLLPSFTITSGTNATVTNTVTGTLTVAAYPTNYTLTFSYTQTFTYNASAHTLTHATSAVSISSNQSWCTPSLSVGYPQYDSIVGDSTKSALGTPTYIDLDIGEAYYINGSEPVSVNNAVNLGSDLPTLPPGATTVNYDNTITDLKIAPRWWKV